MKAALKPVVVALLISAVSAPAYADIVFSGSWDSNPTTTGTMAPGVSWEVNTFGTNSWGSPGVGRATLAWPTTDHVNDFHISFQLPAGVDVVFQQAANCDGGVGGGTTFCSTPFGTPWTAVSDGLDAISFYAPAGSYMTLGNRYFVNIFFTGDVREASFDGRWSVPEPGTLALLGLGLAGLAASRRRKQ